MLDYVRWVMVRKRDEARRRRRQCARTAGRASAAASRRCLPAARSRRVRFRARRLGARWGDYQVGERVDHVDGMTIEESEHQIATRLYQNTARVHFNQLPTAQGVRPPDRLRRPRHLAGAGALVQRPRPTPSTSRHQRRPPRAPLRRRHDLRLARGDGEGRAAGPPRRRRAASAHRRDQGPALRGVPVQVGDDNDPAVVLDLDYWALMPR